MKIQLISVGTKMPDWVEAGVAEYRKRLPRDFELLVTEIPLAIRGKGTDIAKAMAKEGEACLRAVGKGDYVVALDVKGKALSTEQLAEQFRQLRDGGETWPCWSAAPMAWLQIALQLPIPAGPCPSSLFPIQSYG
jgi:23S rRNA (pseudouridine1915-N3)-methyltransferase